MVAKGNSNTRKFVGKHPQPVCELPNLVGIQLESYDRFCKSTDISKSWNLIQATAWNKYFNQLSPLRAKTARYVFTTTVTLLILKTPSSVK